MEPCITVKDDEELQNRKPVMLFGRDIRTIPCFRDSFFYGITTGLATSLISFMFTSRVRMSTNIGFTAMWVCVFGYWVPCRWKYETQQLTAQRWKELMRNKKKVED